ncbi:hypothetical protein [Streptomyces sp. PTY087I2]|uniref:hypothetical protein n=1 Tax=Streptomyces sp. PTY087I2 TaxID=1819298 RepID=UPI00159ED037|nr:hypothetical protein [Streptomyces sp. PTY087I2]
MARIETDEIGDVALDGNRENAYVTDVKGGSLFKINLEKETSIKVGENLGNPMGVTLDDLGNAYVTSGKEILWRVSPGNVQPVQIASIPVTPPATICSTAGVTWNDAHDRVCVTDRSGYLWQVDQVSSRVF